MDTELAHTFLAVGITGSFAGAAERLHVTQSTVSARIKRLEDHLRVRLFVREKSGTRLTSAGERFQRHAAILCRAVEQARQEIGVADGFTNSLTVGGRLGLWEELLVKWLPFYSLRAPGVAIRGVVGFEEGLMQSLMDGTTDIAVMYTPQVRPGLKIERLLDDQLVMVSTRWSPSNLPGPDYIYVDWGPEFLAQHKSAFPSFAGTLLTVNMGWLGLEYLLRVGGTGYFPVRLIREHERAGRLRRVDAPSFLLPAYLCYPAKSASRPLQLAVETLREVVKTSVL